MKKVSFGVINCNRLYYLRSCVESIYATTKDHADKELIIIDNASVEEGTDDYLDDLESRGARVIRMPSRDPANELAYGLNAIVELATGDYVVPLQGDMQFIAEGWLGDYIAYHEANVNRTGCIMFDAQRTVRNFTPPESVRYTAPVRVGNNAFVGDRERNPIGGSGDVFYSREMIRAMYPWSVANLRHEGGEDTETKMLEYVKSFENFNALLAVLPIHPVSVAMYNSEGTNGRVRDMRRYGTYVPPTQDFRYYEIVSPDLMKQRVDTWLDRAKLKYPIGIESVAVTLGWKAPIDESGLWIKNPIRPATAKPGEFVELDYGPEALERLSRREGYQHTSQFAAGYGEHILSLT